MCAPGRRFRRRTRIRQAPADPQELRGGGPPRDRARPSGGGRGAGETAAGDRRRWPREFLASSPRPEAGTTRRSLSSSRPWRASRPARRRCNSGCIELQLGRTQQATRHLTDVLQQGASGRDVEGLFRGARAAQALGRPRDANSLFKAADAASADPAIDTAWGLLFLEKYNKPEALRSLQDALKLDPEWAPAHAGLGRVLADENPPAAAASARKRARDRQASRRRAPAARRARSQQLEARRRAREDSDASSRSTRRTSKRVRGWRRSPTCATTRPAFDAEVEARAGDQPGLRRRLSHRRRSRGAQLPLRGGGRADARRRSALDPGEHARLRRSRHAPDAHRRRGRGAQGARARRSTPIRSTRSPTTCWRCSTRSTSSSVETSGDLIVKFHPDEAAGDARVRDPAGARRAQDAVGEVPVHAEGADPDRDVSRTTTTSPCARSACPG